MNSWAFWSKWVKRFEGKLSICWGKQELARTCRGKTLRVLKLAVIRYPNALGGLSFNRCSELEAHHLLYDEVSLPLRLFLCISHYLKLDCVSNRDFFKRSSNRAVVLVKLKVAGLVHKIHFRKRKHLLLSMIWYNSLPQFVIIVLDISLTRTYIGHLLDLVMALLGSG